jgi:hypothetical protein
MPHNSSLLSLLLLAACSASVSDLDELETHEDACDPRGRAERGTDLDLQFVSTNPHVNQDMFFAVTVGEERSIEAMIVLSTFDDPALRLRVPKLLPGGPSELAFWADSMPDGFDPINDDGDPIDHQWTRPVCPDGKMKFTHTTPFQSVVDALSTGAIFAFMIPDELRRPELFDTFTMWASAILLDDDDPDEEVQTRAFFRWSPLVSPAKGEDAPPQREPPTKLQVGGNALGEPRGAIDTLSLYRIEFVIDVDHSGDLSRADFICNYERQRAPDAMVWEFVPDLAQCDAPAGFDPLTYTP